MNWHIARRFFCSTGEFGGDRCVFFFFWLIFNGDSPLSTLGVL